MSSRPFQGSRNSRSAIQMIALMVKSRRQRGLLDAHAGITSHYK
jgi:hypothetical protein